MLIYFIVFNHELLCLFNQVYTTGKDSLIGIWPIFACWVIIVCKHRQTCIPRGISHMDTILTDKIYLNVDDEMYLELNVPSRLSSSWLYGNSCTWDTVNIFSRYKVQVCKIIVVVDLLWLFIYHGPSQSLPLVRINAYLLTVNERLGISVTIIWSSIHFCTALKLS